MTLATLSWPDAVVHVAWITTAGLVLAVLIWSIFQTGQIAIRNEGRSAARLGQEAFAGLHAYA